ncbi:hypothetical protein ACHAP7_011473 [Fusarium lateritium]
MEAQPVGQVLDLLHLDRILSQIPDAASAAVIRAQIVAGCEAVELKRNEAIANRDEAEALRTQLQEKTGELESELAGLKGSQAKLNLVAEQTSALPGQVGDLVRRFEQMSLDLKQESSTIADRITSMQSLTEDQAAQTLQAIKDDVAERLTVISSTALSSEQRLTTMGTEISAVKKSVAASAADQQLLLDTLTGDGDMRGSWATQVQVESCVQPLITKVEAIQKSVGYLPSKVDVSKALEEAGSYRHFEKYEELLTKCQNMTKERDHYQMESRNLRMEMKILEEKTAIEVDSSRCREALSNERLEEERQRGRRMDNTIQGLEEKYTASHQRLEEAEGSLEVSAGLQQELQDARARLEAAEATAQELQATRNQLRTSRDAVAEGHRETNKLRAKVGYEKQLNTERSQQINEAHAHIAAVEESRGQTEQARTKAEEQVAQLNARFEQFNDLQQQLKEAWATEKISLQKEVSDSHALVDSQKRDLASLHSRVAETKRIQKQLDDTLVQNKQLKGRLKEANHKAETYGQQLSAAHNSEQDLKTALENANSELEDRRRFISRLK